MCAGDHSSSTFLSTTTLTPSPMDNEHDSTLYEPQNHASSLQENAKKLDDQNGKIKGHKGDYEHLAPLFDAHCHPTDSPSTLNLITGMRARCLTVMATREEDQELVKGLVERYGVRAGDGDGDKGKEGVGKGVGRNVEEWRAEEKVIPAWGWHPWFAGYVYFDYKEGKDDGWLEDGASVMSNFNQDEGQGEDTDAKNEKIQRRKSKETAKPQPLAGESKVLHYSTVLQPARPWPSAEERALFLALPDPRPFSSIVAGIRQNLENYPLALVGEIGLDRSARTPYPWNFLPPSASASTSASRNSSDHSQRDTTLTPGAREGRKLTPFKVSMGHQKRVFKEQLRLAGALGRAVSVHSVQAHGAVFEVLRELWKGYERRVLSRRERRKQVKEGRSEEEVNDGSGQDDGEIQGLENTDTQRNEPKPFPPRICLHSFSGPPDLLALYLHPSVPAQIFFSFSTAINLPHLPPLSLSSTLSSTIPSTTTTQEEENPTPQPFADLLRKIPDDKILVESDLHTAGEEMDERLEDMARRICGVKGWRVAEGREVLGRNWKRFVGVG